MTSSRSRKSSNSRRRFSSSHVNQMLSSLINAGLVYKDRHGKYVFAVPLLGGFIRRQHPEIAQEGLELES